MKSRGANVGFSPRSKEHEKRAELMQQFWDYYRGHHKQHVKVTPGQPNDNVILNYSRKIVNMGINFLVADGVTFEIDGNREERTKEEQYLDSVYADDPLNGFNLNDFMQGVALSGAVTGMPFVRLYEAGPYPGRDKLPSVVLLDSTLLDVITDPDDFSRPIEYCILWQSGEAWKRHRYIRNDSDTWDYVEEIADKSNRWQTELEETWKYSWAPIFHAQNLKNPRGFWGASDLEDADMNDKINFVASNTNRIIKLHAHPRTIIFGTESNQFKVTAVDNLYTIANEDARAENLEMQSDLSSSREHLESLKQDYFSITETPMLDPTQVAVGALSGFALKILYGPLLSKTDGKRIRYGGMMSRLNHAILELSGAKNPPLVNTVWSDPLPGNKKEAAELFKILVDGGAAIDAAAKIAGYTQIEADMLADTTALPEIEL